MNKTFYGTASITNSHRTQVINIENSPGPAAYDPCLEDQDRIPHWTLKPKIEESSCFVVKSRTPGIGEYKIESMLNIVPKSQAKGLKPLTSKMYLDKSTHQSDLNLPSYIATDIGSKFGFRDEVVERERSPGPIYHADKILEEARRAKKGNSRGLGFGTRSDISMDAKHFPGPGSYCPEKYPALSSHWSFSKSEKKVEIKKSVNPLGPGTYNINLNKPGRSCKLKGRHITDKPQTFANGPGSYNLPDNKSKIGTKFAHTNKNENELINNKVESPSPCSYTPIKSGFSGSGFSIGQKLDDKRGELVLPGPGSYELRKEDSSWQPGGYMGRKFQRKKGEKSDNFYKYTPNMKPVNNQAPSYTFPKKSSDHFDKANPRLGPGSYLYKHDGNSNSYTIPKDQRFKPLTKEKRITYKVNQNAYSTIGYLPGYLKKREEIGSKQKERNTNKQNKF